jgi:hypothetical protein
VKRNIHRRLPRFGIALAAGAAIALTAAGLATAGLGRPSVAWKLTGRLSSAQMSPAPAAAVPANATGEFMGVLIRSQAGQTRLGGGPPVWRLVWRLTYSGLSSPATGAQIHTGAQGASGPHIAGLCGPCATVTKGSMELNATQALTLLRGNAYVQVATANNPSGEIRGQIHRARTLTVTPPATQSATRPTPSSETRSTPRTNRDK